MKPWHLKMFEADTQLIFLPAKHWGSGRTEGGSVLPGVMLLKHCQTMVFGSNLQLKSQMPLSLHCVQAQ
jgi:hypothetical protein